MADLYGYADAIASSNARARQISTYNEEQAIYNSGIPDKEKKEASTINEQTYIEEGKDAVTDAIASHRMYTAKVYGGKAKAPSNKPPDSSDGVNEEATETTGNEPLQLEDRPPAEDDIPDPIPEEEEEPEGRPNEPAPSEDPEPERPTNETTGGGEPDGGGESAPTTSNTAETVDEAGDDAKTGFKIGEETIETASRVGGAALAVGNLGMNLAADFDGDWKGMNAGEKAGNVISSIGSALDLVGVVAGPEALPLVAVGGLISLIGGVTSGISDVVKASDDKKNIPNEPDNQPKPMMDAVTLAQAGGGAAPLIE